MVFRIKLQGIHKATGKSVSQVCEETGLNYNTVRRYVIPRVAEFGRIDPAYIVLANYYGVDWRDPEILEFVPDAAPLPKALDLLLA